MVYDGDCDTSNRTPTGLHVLVNIIPVIVALVAIFALIMRKLQSAATPIAINCSATISPACNSSVGDTDAAEKPVMWGEVNVDVANLSIALGPGIEHFQTECHHCSLTCEKVEERYLRILYYRIER